MMSETHQPKIGPGEKQALLTAGAVAAAASAAVAIAVVYRQRRVHRPADPNILETTIRSEERRLRLNDVAACMLLQAYPTRESIVNTLGISKHHASHYTSYLVDNGLVERATSTFADGSMIQHYEATAALVGAASDHGAEHDSLVAAIDQLVFSDNS